MNSFGKKSVLQMQVKSVEFCCQFPLTLEFGTEPCKVHSVSMQVELVADTHSCVFFLKNSSAQQELSCARLYPHCLDCIFCFNLTLAVL